MARKNNIKSSLIRDQIATRRSMLASFDPNDPFFPTLELAIYEYILENGKDYTPVPRPKGMRKHADRACWQNAFRLADDVAYRYCEGFALDTTKSFGIIQHAWLIDEDGNAVDPTYPNPLDHQYFGVEFTARSVSSVLLEENRHCSVIEWRMIDKIKSKPARTRKSPPMVKGAEPASPKADGTPSNIGKSPRVVAAEVASFLGKGNHNGVSWDTTQTDQVITITFRVRGEKPLILTATLGKATKPNIHHLKPRAQTMPDAPFAGYRKGELHRYKPAYLLASMLRHDIANPMVSGTGSKYRIAESTSGNGFHVWESENFIYTFKVKDVSDVPTLENTSFRLPKDFRLN